MHMKKGFPSIVLMMLTAMVVLYPITIFAAPPPPPVTVLTVPWDPTNPLSPHSTYPTSPSTEIPVVLQATVPSAVGSSDTFSVRWHFGDVAGSGTDVTFTLTNPYDISTTHQYPASAGAGTAWTAVVTVTDTTTTGTGTANYYVTQQADNLAARVN